MLASDEGIIIPMQQNSLESNAETDALRRQRTRVLAFVIDERLLMVSWGFYLSAQATPHYRRVSDHHHPTARNARFRAELKSDTADSPMVGQALNSTIVVERQQSERMTRLDTVRLQDEQIGRC
jgi:hypothetical protein